MKKWTDEELQDILANIQNGVNYCGIANGYGIGHIRKTPQGNIGYQHYGASAIKSTIKNLRWILEVIFAYCDTITPCKWSEYHINHIPIDTQYEGVDMSTQHPNVFGK